MATFFNLQQIGVKDQIAFHSMALNDFRSVLQVLSKVQPDEIYNLTGQSSVGLSFDQPVETLEIISVNIKNTASRDKNPSDNCFFLAFLVQPHA
jgi:GDPmannose 4,6-dehydratase